MKGGEYFMGKPQFFIQNKVKEETSNGKSFPVMKWLSFTLLFLVVLGVLAYGGLKAKGAIDSVSSNWSEIQFAMEKPELVKAMREDYRSKQAKLDKEFTTSEKTSEEKLVDEVVKRLETADSLK